MLSNRSLLWSRAASPWPTVRSRRLRPSRVDCAWRDCGGPPVSGTGNASGLPTIHLWEVGCLTLKLHRGQKEVILNIRSLYSAPDAWKAGRRHTHSEFEHNLIRMTLVSKIDAVRREKDSRASCPCNNRPNDQRLPGQLKLSSVHEPLPMAALSAVHPGQFRRALFPTPLQTSGGVVDSRLKDPRSTTSPSHRGDMVHGCGRSGCSRRGRVKTEHVGIGRCVRCGPRDQRLRSPKGSGVSAFGVRQLGCSTEFLV